MDGDNDPINCKFVLFVCQHRVHVVAFPNLTPDISLFFVYRSSLVRLLPVQSQLCVLCLVVVGVFRWFVSRFGFKFCSTVLSISQP